MCRNSEYCSIFTTVLFVCSKLYIFTMFFVKMQNNTEENYYFFPLHQTHNYTYILWAYDKQCFYCIVNEILLFCFLHKACIYYIKKVIYFIEIVYIYKHWIGVLYRLYRFYFFTKKLLGISYFANIGIFLFFLIYFLYAYIYAM